MPLVKLYQATSSVHTCTKYLSPIYDGPRFECHLHAEHLHLGVARYNALRVAQRGGVTCSIIDIVHNGLVLILFQECSILAILKGCHLTQQQGVVAFMAGLVVHLEGHQGDGLLGDVKTGEVILEDAQEKVIAGCLGVAGINGDLYGHAHHLPRLAHRHIQQPLIIHEPRDTLRFAVVVPLDD
ncbi:hypothetical protein FGO68_gene15577 [Halteria grandinella]|uniref:Uncharacterized protein n=1 Tax=Halteria grandinella TaxID=5974 RepID=A0A8J8NRU7_HALGN|nr:hypothetical protein FGO68_gene15577 [Halteria grandinella]